MNWINLSIAESRSLFGPLEDLNWIDKGDQWIGAGMIGEKEHVREALIDLNKINPPKIETPFDSDRQVGFSWWIYDSLKATNRYDVYLVEYRVLLGPLNLRLYFRLSGK